MTAHDATEQAYKNGYEKGKTDAFAEDKCVDPCALPCRIDLLRNGIRAMSEEELAAWCAAASAEPFPTATTSAALAAAIMSAALRKEGQNNGC